MVRISDIFDRHDDERKKKKDIPSVPDVNIDAGADKGIPATGGVSEAGDLYKEMASLIKRLYKTQLSEYPDLELSIKSIIGRIIDSLAQGNQELLHLATSDYFISEEYLYYHAANSCIISLLVGSALGYEKAKMMDLGLAAMLHDIGIVKYTDIVNKKEVLTKEEYNKIKEHPIVSKEMLNKFGITGINIVQAVQQEHERLDGTGYPSGLKSDNVSEFAQIIGLVDVYEAMLHIRPYRSKHSPLETIKLVLNDKSAFNSRVIKIIIEKIGIFPIGTRVRLNTKETGYVIRNNGRLPLRPLVEIRYDSYGKELKQVKNIDLAENTMICIEECLTNSKS
ncbi:HD domain-containing protein [bacterium]|nr:MAG: HD domain-containing protein [bacterium]